MKANIRQHLAFHIHVFVVSLFQLGIVLFNTVVSVSVVRSCPSPSRLCCVVPCHSLSPSPWLFVSLLPPIGSCPFLPTKHLSRQMIVYSIPHNKDCSQKKNYHNNITRQLKKISVSVPLYLCLRLSSNWVHIIATRCRWAEASIIAFVTVLCSFVHLFVRSFGYREENFWDKQNMPLYK